MKLRCPKSNRHKFFTVIAHVAETWKVDSQGDFIEVLEPSIEVVHSPDSEDLYSCRTCGSEAIVEEDL